MAKKVLTHHFSTPLDSAATAKVSIDPGDGNLLIDQLTSSEALLASGDLQYLESNGQPNASVQTSHGQAALTMKASGKGQPWFHFPWSACNGATEWQVHLNPLVSIDLTAHSDGGNVRLDLAGLTITRLSADTGGGNMDVVLPDNATCLSVTAKTGAGNVVVEFPSGIAARVNATSGLGKVIVDPKFVQIDKHTFQSPDYEHAADKVEITASSGAGNVVIKERISQAEAAALRI